MNRLRMAGIGLIAIASMGLLAACGGGGDPTVSEFRRGAAGADAAVEGFIAGWQRGSGPARDTIAASQTRRFLGGDLGARVASATVGGSQTAEPLERMFNDIMMAPFPPDGDPAFELLESVSVSETETQVTIRLNYTPNAASALAARGIVPFDKVNDYHQQVQSDNTRILTLREGELGWQIYEVVDGD